MDVIVEKLNGILWGPWFIYGILLIGLFFSIITRFLQVRHIKDMFVLMFKGRSQKREYLHSKQCLSHYQDV